MAKVCAIVGVGPGIGASTARRFAKEGYTLALLARGKEKLETIKQQIEEHVSGSKGKILTIDADATNEQQVQDAFKKIRDTIGDPEVLIYNASGYKRAPFLELKAQDYINNFNVSSLGAFLAAQQVLPNMVKNKKGTLLFTGATASVRGSAYFAAFASGKFSLRALSQSLAREFGPQGIHIAHVIVDGGVDTSYTHKETLMSPDGLANIYWDLHSQHPTTWTYELDVRPNVEKW
eukprot:Phypoly_transcript_16896.p1 GENE.Phypoly_transcript_16896~~Phypoly_transcript_16896.p1  ORF type:complete len:234 (+),score=38.37 Phypoly_transcript_16896:92-793(+)